MEKTVSQILEIKNALGEFTKKELPSKLSYWLGRIEDEINPSFNRFSKENNKIIVEKYGVKVEGTETFKVPVEKFKEYNDEVSILLEQKEEIKISIKLDLFDGVLASKEFFIAMGDLVKPE